MIIVTSEEVVLGSTEVAELATFLRTSSGQKVLKALAALRPDILGDPFSAGRASGYEEAIANLIHMILPVKAPKEDSITDYPNLDDDSAWTDLEKQSEAEKPKSDS